MTPERRAARSELRRHDRSQRRPACASRERRGRDAIGRCRLGRGGTHAYRATVTLGGGSDDRVQAFNLIGDLSVAENVELPLTYRGLSAGERRRRTVDELDRVSMSHRARHQLAQLSGGQQQRVAVARAIAGEPVLLADEPTGNLDTANGELVMNLLAELHAAGSTIVMVTHDRRFNRFATRTIELLDGAIATATATVQEKVAALP